MIDIAQYTYGTHFDELQKYNAKELRFIQLANSSCDISVYIPKNTDLNQWVGDLFINCNNKNHTDINLYLYKPLRYCKLYIMGSNINFYSFTSGSFRSIFMIYENSNIILGEDSTANGVRVVTNNSDLFVGRDVMFSHDIEVQTCDQHSVIDLDKMQELNSCQRNSITLKDHVWIGKKAMILKNVTLGQGAIVGAGSVVTKNIPDFTAVGGNPAKTIKNNVSWIRNKLNRKEEALFTSFKQSRISKFPEGITGKNEIIFFDHVLNRYVLSNDEIKFFDITNKVFLQYHKYKQLYHSFMMCNDYELVSLGGFCLPHTLPIKWGLKNTRRELNSNVRMPFDLAVTPINSLLEILKNDFTNYYADGIRKNNDTEFIFINTKLGIRYNHDIYNTSDNITLNDFNDILNKRVSEFKKTYDKNSLYILHCLNLEKSMLPVINEIKEIITKKTKGKMIVINETSKNDNSTNEFPDYVYSAHKPKVDYIWYKSLDYLTPEGFEFDFGIINFIYDNLKDIVSPNYKYKNICLDRGTSYYHLAANYLKEKKRPQDAEELLMKSPLHNDINVNNP